MNANAKIYPEILQGSEAWDKLHIGRLTSRHADSLLTAKTWIPSASRADLALELTMQSIAGTIDLDALDGMEVRESADMRRGREVEPIAREWLAAQLAPLGLEIREVGFISRVESNGLELAGTSPDGLIYRDNEPVGLVEIKGPRAKKQLYRLAHPGLPSEHKLQTHYHMAIAGLPCVFVSYHQHPRLAPMVALVPIDDDTRKMSDAIDEFIPVYAETRARVKAEIERLRGEPIPKLGTLRTQFGLPVPAIATDKEGGVIL